MNKTNRVEFELLGQTYAIRSDATPEYVRQLVAHVEKTIKQIQKEGGPKDPQKLAVLAAFYIADELVQSRDARRQTEGAVSARVGTLLELLEKTVPS